VAGRSHFTAEGTGLIQEPTDFSNGTCAADRPMTDQRIPVNRTLVGLIALTCLAGAATIGVVDTWENLWCAAFVRVGLLMGAFWVALPSSRREAAWANLSPYTILVALVAVFIVARWRSALPVVIAVGVLALVLRPRQRRRPR
jgi:hypothetical protein